MSPRAAWRLESLGFTEVYDYVAGKADWGAAGLQLEGRAVGVLRAGDVARRDAPICGLDERLADVRRRVERTDWELCVVVNDDRVVLGLLGRSALREGATAATAEEAMTSGPVTVRPDVRADRLLASLERRNGTAALVTTSDGRLVGAALVEDLRSLLRAASPP